MIIRVMFPAGGVGLMTFLSDGVDSCVITRGMFPAGRVGMMASAQLKIIHNFVVKPQ